MRQLWVPSGVEEYQLQSAVANICPNFDDGDYDRRSDHRSNAISRCMYICLNFGPLPVPAQVPPLCRQVLVNLSKEQFILHPAPVTWCCLASLSFLDQSALLMVLF